MPMVKLHAQEDKENKERQKKKATKVRFDLDNYHEELGGLFAKKVIFYCMPKRTPRKTGDMEKARNFFRNYHGPGESLFITVNETKENYYNLSKEGPFELTIGRNVEPNKLVIVREFGQVIIYDVHFLNTQRIIKILNEFLSAVMTTKLLCFGTNTSYEGIPYQGAIHLESVADKVIYDKSACRSCMRVGKKRFSKSKYERHIFHSHICPVLSEDVYYLQYLYPNCRQCKK